MVNNSTANYRNYNHRGVIIEFYTIENPASAGFFYGPFFLINIIYQSNIFELKKIFPSSSYIWLFNGFAKMIYKEKLNSRWADIAAEQVGW